MKKNNKKAVSLSELLIAIGILGVLAALTVPSVVRTLPNENELRYRQVYGRMLNVVNSVLYDSNSKFNPFMYCKEYSSEANNKEYPCTRREATKGDKVDLGFLSYNNQKTNFSIGKIKDIGPTFCMEVAKRFNVKGDINCAYSTDPTQKNFTISNGITFYGLQKGFGLDEDLYFYRDIEICVDVNGDKGPNIGCANSNPDDSVWANPKRDQLRLSIGYKGTIAVGFLQDDLYDTTKQESLSTKHYCIKGIDNPFKCYDKPDEHCNFNNKEYGSVPNPKKKNYCIERSYLGNLYYFPSDKDVEKVSKSSYVNQDTASLSLSEVCAYQYNSYTINYGSNKGTCVAANNTPFECINTCDGRHKQYDLFCYNNNCAACNYNCYAGAVKACEDQGMTMPQSSTLLIAEQFSQYGVQVIDPNKNYFGKNTLAIGMATSDGSPIDTESEIGENTALGSDLGVEDSSLFLFTNQAYYYNTSFYNPETSSFSMVLANKNDMSNFSLKCVADVEE